MELSPWANHPKDQPLLSFKLGQNHHNRALVSIPSYFFLSVFSLYLILPQSISFVNNYFAYSRCFFMAHFSLRPFFLPVL